MPVICACYQRRRVRQISTTGKSVNQRQGFFLPFSPCGRRWLASWEPEEGLPHRETQRPLFRLEFAEPVIGRAFARPVGSFEPPSPTRGEGKALSRPDR